MEQKNMEHLNISENIFLKNIIINALSVNGEK
jgi:hypothetical protein